MYCNNYKFALNAYCHCHDIFAYILNFNDALILHYLKNKIIWT